MTETPRNFNTAICTANPAKLSHRIRNLSFWRTLCLDVTGIVRRFGNLYCSKIDESFHLSLRPLSLHLQTPVGTFAAGFSNAVSVSTHFQSRPPWRPPLTSNQTTGTQHRGSATMTTQYECGSVSCARAVLSGLMACGSWSVAVHISKRQITLKMTHA